LSKLSASRGVVCAFCIVPVTVVAMALLVMVHGRNGKAERASTSASSSPSGTSTAAARSRMQASYAALPLAFEPNQGQTDAQVKYLARGSGYTLFLTANDAVFSLRSRHAKKESNAVVRMHLAGGNSPAKIEGGDSLPGVANYFLGNDPGKWSTGVPRFGRVAYQDIYPGVNLAFHGRGQELEFDFVVAPGANATPIAFRFSGNRGLKTDDAGNLIVTSAAGNVVLHKPVAYQERNGTRQLVDARFALKASNQVSFELGSYDRSRELVIDPSVSYAYSTYLGGTGNDSGFGIAFDSAGNAYVTGQTTSANFPGASNAIKGTAGNVFVAKIKADGSGLVYSTYVGGTGALGDSGNAIAVNQATGAAYVAGGTSSSDFPATLGAYQTAIAAGATLNAFVFELNPSGAIAYCTYLGGNGADSALGIALDGSGNVYAVGKTSSTNFPHPGTPLQSAPAGGFLSELDPTGVGLVFSTYLGGSTSSFDYASAVALDSSNNIYVTGSTSGTAFPGAPTGVIQPAYGGGTSDAFIASVKPSGVGYNYFTFLGGSNGDVGDAIAVDSSKNAYVAGQTASTDFHLVTPAMQSAFGGGTDDAFVAKVNPGGTALLYSTYLGGSGGDTAAGIAVDTAGNAYVTGQTASSNFPTAIPTQVSLGGGNDAFVSEINPAGSALVFSTYLGGTLDEDDGGKFGAIAVDGPGANIYVTGNTASTDFFTWPSTPLQLKNGGGTQDAFVVKYAQSTAAPTFSLSATALSPGTVGPGSSATSTVTVTPPNGFGGTVTLTCAVSPVVTLGPTCSAASATTTAAATLTVSTTAPTAVLRHPKNRSFVGILYATFLPVGGLVLLGLGLGSESRRKKMFGASLVILVLGGLLLMPACGGGSTKTTGGGSAGTPANTYTITVSGTATGATQTGTAPALTLIVN